jgi:hypothetical protein
VNLQDTQSQRWLVNLILLVAAVLQLARIVQVQSSTGETPFLSANDRSRWCTIASLAINGSYEIDDVVQMKDPQSRRRNWYTIDMVRHRGQDGKQHYYSSKPPLLPTLYAAAYYVVRAITGRSLMNDPFFVARLLLVLVNLLPLVAFWWLLSRWLERNSIGTWALFIATLFIGFGTYLSTFANTLNNHLPGAIAIGISLGCIDRIALGNDYRWRWFVLCGLATSFGAANELPALSWVAAGGAILFMVNPWRTCIGYVPALLPVALAFFATNYIAHGEYVPAYAHRALGEKLFDFKDAGDADLGQLNAGEIAAKLQAANFEISSRPTLRPARRDGVWELWDEATEQRFGLQRIAETSIGVYRWGDWYDYPGSYWVGDRKQGVDKGEPNRNTYIFHCLIGHHGIFSLTPFWLISLLGCFCIWQKRETWNVFRDHRLLIAAAILATSIVAIAFYLARPMEDRNYGGVTSGFRWAFWLTVPWIWLALHGLKEIQSPWGRRSVELLLAISIFSAIFPWSNPWTSPWLMQLWAYLGWQV